MPRPFDAPSIPFDDFYSTFDGLEVTPRLVKLTGRQDTILQVTGRQDSTEATTGSPESPTSTQGE